MSSILIPFKKIHAHEALRCVFSQSEVSSEKVEEVLDWPNCTWLKPTCERHGLNPSDSHLSGELFLKRDGRRILANGQISFKVRAECVRCLEKFPLECIQPIEAYFYNESSGLDLEKELESEDLDGYVMSHQGVSLDELLVDAVELAIPDCPVCSEDCLGLCVECGENLFHSSQCSRQNCPRGFQC